MAGRSVLCLVALGTSDLLHISLEVCLTTLLRFCITEGFEVYIVYVKGSLRSPKPFRSFGPFIGHMGKKRGELRILRRDTDVTIDIVCVCDDPKPLSEELNNLTTRVRMKRVVECWVSKIFHKLTVLLV